MTINLLRDSRILLVEDQMIIAMDVEYMLEENGVAVTDTATTAAEALSIIAKVRPDAAVLDYSLGSGTSLPVAEALLQQNIPFVFATGYGDNSMIPPTFSHVRVVGKPYDATVLANALSAAIAEVPRSPELG